MISNTNPTEPSHLIHEQRSKMNYAKKSFQDYVKHYLDNQVLKRNQTKEFEIRFGTNDESSVPLSKIDYDNVVKQLLKSGFHTDNPNGTQMLRINYEDSNGSSNDKIKMANIRAEVTGVDLIQEYCKTNSIQKIIDMPSNFSNKIYFTQKSSSKNEKEEWQKPIDMFDMNFRVSYQYEQTFHTHVPFIKSVIDTWSDRKKTFRMMNRVRFSHTSLPIFADLSIVRSSKKFGKRWGGGGVDGEQEDNFKRGGTKVAMPTYTVQESGLFQNSETYEIELEIDNTRVGLGNPLYDTPEKVMDMLRSAIRIVLCGIQKSHYPISFTERDDVLHSYSHILKGIKEPKPEHYPKINVRDKKDFLRNFPFIGPGSITLQRENILPKKNGSTYACVLENYTVTDKADGDRKLLFINHEGKIYLINSNLNVEFTGMKTSEKTVFNSILDGEHIRYDKKGASYNYYAAFDVYFINKKSFREKMFYPSYDSAASELPGNYRLTALYELVQLLKPSSIVDTTITGQNPCILVIQSKHFEIVSQDKSLFECCANIMNKINDGLFQYHTDGLIFTPSNVGVGGTSVGATEVSVGPLANVTWELSFKWKPVEQNTIDFLVTVKKDKTGKDEILNILHDGIEQYKTLELMCGYNESNDGFLNPYQDILNDKIPEPLTKTNSNINKRDYRPELFIPSDPYDVNAYITKVKLKNDGNSLFMVSEEGDYFEDYTIVEFRYDVNRAHDRRWVPLRVRYDKTQKLRNGEKQFGNAYRVANSNWHSIHYPITEEMLTTGIIPEFVEEEGVYYKGNTENNTQGLRDFHNLFVKKKLISGISNNGDNLIDYAVGMAGDLPKWISSKLGFVFGIDIAYSNIHNNKRGACARYLNMRRDLHSIPGALFVVGDSGLNIRELKAFPGDNNSKDKMVTNAVFGKGPKDETVIGKGTYKYYGIGEQGFHISSCQFAVHYFFENNIKLHGFLRNISECTKINGYFIGTCYDGKSIFKLLKSKTIGESVVFNTLKSQKICEIVKQYHDSGFPDDNSSVGYAIDVYQESINQLVREYLVNFNYLTELMGHYGFVLLNDDEAKHAGLPGGSGLFSELFKFMKNEIKINHRIEGNYKSAPFITDAEKSLSFLNRYFVFKKTMNVDAGKISKLLLKSASTEIEDIAMTEIENEIQKTLKKRPAVQGNIIKTKLRTTLG